VAHTFHQVSGIFYQGSNTFHLVSEMYEKEFYQLNELLL